MCVSIDSFLALSHCPINQLLLVSNLPADTESDELMSIFSEHGKVEHIEIRNLADRIFAFVTMHNVKQAKDAASSLSMYDFRGNIISTVVEI